MQRGMDYLETRSDIDAHKIALVNHSTFTVSSVFAAVDTRYSALVLLGAGVFPELLTVAPTPIRYISFPTFASRSCY